MTSPGGQIRFVHVPQLRRRAGEPDRRSVMAIPVGVFSLAALARTVGWRSSIVHTGLEALLDPGYRLEEDRPTGSPRVVALDLHWHPQLPMVLRAAARLKRVDPELKVLLGGITATCFARELMEIQDVDFVIRGDGERPLVELLRRLDAGERDLSEVPNLSWRCDTIRHNAQDHCATSADMDAAEYDVTLLRHYEHYSGAIEHPPPPGADGPLWGSPRCFHVVVGRGCTINCGYCGGSARSTRRLFGRRGVIVRSPERVEADLRAFSAAGFETMYFGFDPPGMKHYYLDLFTRVADGGSLPSAVIELYQGLPDEALLRAYRSAFDEAVMVLSPGSAVAAVRDRHGLLGHSNEEYEDAVRRMVELDVQPYLYFTMFPDDTLPTLRATADWMASLQQRFGVPLEFVCIEIEPGCAWIEEPERFGMRLRRRTFQDFVRHHAFGSPDDLGYEIEQEDEKRRLLSDIIFPLVRGS